MEKIIEKMCLTILCFLAALPTQASCKEIVDRYGYEDGYSVLSFDIIPETLKEHDGYYENTPDGSDRQLFDENSNQVDAPIYKGKLYIRKDATIEEAICDSIEPVSKEALNQGRWFNGVYFDEDRYVTRLVYFGD